MTNNAINAPNVNHGLFVGTGAGSYTGVAIGTSGEALVSAGSSADPAFGVVQPVGGGTGQSSLDAHSVIIGEGTSPVAFADPTGFVTGNPLVSQGGGNDPVFSDTATVNQITIIDTPVNPDDGVPKFYVDLIAAGFSFKQACFAASTTAFIANYSNGASGVGATLTNNSTLDAFSVDGTSPSLNDRILIKDQAAALQNGIYTLTTVGDNVTPWVLTRAIDYDSSAEITPGSITAILNGTVNEATFWVQTDVVNTVGTDPIEFVQFGFSPSDFLLRVNNLSDLDDATTARANLGLTNIAIQNVTQYNTLVGGASDSITSITPGSAGDLYVSTGASSDPNFITPTAGTGLSLTSDGTNFEYALDTPVSVANGGTGATSFNSKGIVVAGATGTSALSALQLTNGQVLIGNTGNTPSTATLTAGTNISITNGSGSITINATASGALTLIVTKTASNSASISFNNTEITSAYKNYLISINNVTSVTSNVTFGMQVSTNNGVSYLSTGYTTQISTAPNATVGTIISATSTSNLFLVNRGGGGMGSFCSGNIHFYNLGVSSTPTASGNLMYIDVTSTNSHNIMTGGILGSSINVNNIIFTMSSGNISTGNFSLYGMSS